MITKKSIKELVELVEEGKLNEIVFEDEIERAKYVIYKNEIGVGIQKTDMDKRKEPVKPYREAILEGPSNPILDKAMDYMINPYPKVSDSVLEMYKSFLSDEHSRIAEIDDRVRKEANGLRENLKVLEEDLKDNNSFRNERQELIEHLETELVKRNFALNDIMVRKGQIADFIEKV